MLMLENESRPTLAPMVDNYYMYILFCIFMVYYVVPNSRACTAIYLGGNLAYTALLRTAHLLISGNDAYTFFYLDHFL